MRNKEGNVEFDDGDRLPFAYDYLRVTQEDGHIAWSSPIWVVLNTGKKEIRWKHSYND